MRERISEDETLREIWWFAWEVQSEHADRFVALAAASLLEEALEGILTDSLVELSADESGRLFADDRGILGTFAARIEMAYAVGAIGPNVRHDLTTIRYIRNAFAHIRSVLAFDSPEIVSMCNDLRYPQKTDSTTRDLSGEMITPRSKFIETARVRWINLSFPGTLNRAQPYPPSRPRED